MAKAAAELPTAGGRHADRPRLFRVALGAVSLLLWGTASMQPAPAAAQVAIDRVAVRFSAPDTGGPGAPRFIFERELAFEASLEALADPQPPNSLSAPAFELRHVRTALERHIGEALLSSLRIHPEPEPREMEARTGAARVALVQAIGGLEALDLAMSAEKMGSGDLARLLSRRARASLYIDRMVRPAVEPSDAELRALHAVGQTPWPREPFADVLAPLRRWYLATRLRTAVSAFYESARARLTIEYPPLLVDRAKDRTGSSPE